MRKIVLLLAIFFNSSLLAVEKVQFPASFANGWDPYIGKMVQITTPLYVCGNYYDSLILAPERLYVPEGSTWADFVMTGSSQGDNNNVWYS